MHTIGHRKSDVEEEAGTELEEEEVVVEEDITKSIDESCAAMAWAKRRSW